MTNNFPYHPPEGTYFARILARYLDTCDPLHALAISYMTTDSALENLKRDYCPKTHSNCFGKNGQVLAYQYFSTNTGPTPQVQFVVKSDDPAVPVSVVDLVLPLLYRRIKFGYCNRERYLIEEGDHFVPLLINVRLDPETVEPAILDFNLIRKAIRTYSDSDFELHGLFDNACILVTRRILSQSEVRMLEDANIRHFQLDGEFDGIADYYQWCQSNSPESDATKAVAK